MTFSNEITLQILDQLSTSILVFDANLKLKCMNIAAEDMLSVSSNRSLGMVPEDIWPKSTFFSRVIKKSLTVSESKRIERGIQITLNNNRKITVDCILTPFFEEDEIREIIVELTDVNTQERILRAASQKSLQETAHESIQGIAHEVKNPLGGIRGAAQLLEGELDNEELKEYTRIIVNESDRLRNLIDKMMLPAKSMNKKSQVNIHEVLEYLVSLVRAENTQAIQIRKNYDPSIPEIYADREQLIQAVLNIIRNAIQAINENGTVTLRTRIRRKVTINSRLNRQVIVLEIIDDGPGIPIEIEQGAFYPMITSRPEGTGLGLTIAQQIIHSHNGMISYERENDKTYFTILLPIG